MEISEEVTPLVAGILSLPQEILELILCCDALECGDICHVAQCCSQLRSVAHTNEIWRQKLQLRYPRLYRKYKKHDQTIDWRTEYQLRVQYGKEVWKHTAALSHKYYTKTEISNEGFRDYMWMVEEHGHGLDFIIDELIAIINDPNKHKDLTVKYYAKKSIRYFHPLRLKEEWKQLFELPEAQQTLEKGAVLIAQWCQPTADVILEDIVGQIDEIAERVRCVVLEKVPHHPIGSGIEQDVNELTESLWPPLQCKRILDCTNQVLFKEMGFSGNENEEDQYFDERNSFIHEVLSRKRGIPITLCLLYSCITRRLGVICELVGFPSHFLLKWKEHPELDADSQYTNIDAYGGGTMLTKVQCKSLIGGPFMTDVHVSDSVFNGITTKQVFERMARNLVNIGRHHSQIGSELAALRSTIELFLAIRPGDIEHWLLLARLYLYLDINLIEVEDMFQHIVEQDPVRFGIMASLSERAQQRLEVMRQEGTEEEVKPTKRGKNCGAEYSIGMIMKHKRYEYSCVVYGWDETCQASQEWIVQMGVHHLPKKHKQPFYNVLAEDCSVRYAAQENLEYMSDPKDVPHPEVGKHFCEFTGTHYKPNEEKMKEYPDDYALTLEKAERMYSKHSDSAS